MKKILICVGGRPNMMKAASLFRVSSQFPELSLQLLHTGQHYSKEMDEVFFEQLCLPAPDYHLNVGSGSHASQTAQIMVGFEKVLAQHAFDLVVVIGDMNSTVACALVATKLQIKVAHIEAGLRSFDTGMPEEINRKITDHISDYLFTTEKSANVNLAHEGIDLARIFFVGNTMIDTLVSNLISIEDRQVLTTFGLEKDPYCVLTLHRPANVDTSDELAQRLQNIVENIPAQTKIIFPVHPRTQKMMEHIPDDVRRRFVLIAPQPYFSFMSLVYHADFVLTDSGGIQEETTYLKKPCFTLRPNTERPSTTDMGSNFLINKNLEAIRPSLQAFDVSQVAIPPLWDGQAGKRILEKLTEVL
ncbi:MAG: UDP-N-acetylglucosamine 2-epimerase (non-hydrolyzing) [Deltaproteobacteria bacterium]|nr:UDP-N-acetylglucosamine 2-epimerase (non-hydrolyzing) [Deltaproteobacteria bacterium]